MTPFWESKASEGDVSALKEAAAQLESFPSEGFVIGDLSEQTRDPPKTSVVQVLN